MFSWTSSRQRQRRIGTCHRGMSPGASWMLRRGARGAGRDPRSFSVEGCQMDGNNGPKPPRAHAGPFQPAEYGVRSPRLRGGLIASSDEQRRIRIMRPRTPAFCPSRPSPFFTGHFFFFWHFGTLGTLAPFSSPATRFAWACMEGQSASGLCHLGWAAAQNRPTPNPVIPASHSTQCAPRALALICRASRCSAAAVTKRRHFRVPASFGAHQATRMHGNIGPESAEEAKKQLADASNDPCCRVAGQEIPQTEFILGPAGCGLCGLPADRRGHAQVGLERAGQALVRVVRSGLQSTFGVRNTRSAWISSCRGEISLPTL